MHHRTWCKYILGGHYVTNYREILRLHSQGISQRSIAASCACSRNTVAKVLSQAQEGGVSWPFKEGISNAELHRLFFPETAIHPSRKRPDYEYIHKEMAKSGVTLSLLWSEYCESCRQSNEIPLMYSQFCYHYQQFTMKTKVTMHIHRKPGEQLEVDWAGQTTPIIDSITGEILNTYVFVGALSSSQYAYVEAFLSQNQECWIAAHVNMYKYDEVGEMSMAAIKKLNAAGIRCTVLTKGLLPIELANQSSENEYGITLISLDEGFRKKIEPAASSYADRIAALKVLHDKGCRTWVSIEPYPTPNIIEQNLLQILNTVSFVNKIIFGRTNYNKEITAFTAHKAFYNQQVDIVIDLCERNGVNYHIKDGTMT